MGRSEAKSTTGGGALCTSVISGRRESWRKANCAMKIRKCDGKNRFTHLIDSAIDHSLKESDSDSESSKSDEEESE